MKFAICLLPLVLACDSESSGSMAAWTATEGSSADANDTGGSADTGTENGGEEDGQTRSAGDEGPGDEGPGDDGTTDHTGSEEDDTGSEEDGPDGGGDPNCYTEPLFPDVAVDDIVATYGGGGYKDQVIEAMGRRWPAGAYLLQAQIGDPYWAQFSDPNSWSGMVDWLDTLVHEQTHLFNGNYANSGGLPHALYFREDKIVTLPADQGFARSEIMQHLIPEVAASTYASTYLVGSQGARLFNPLLDEATAYANEVAGLAVFGEYFDGLGVSLRDGSAAFLYFIEVYLRVGRTEHPEWYRWAQSQDGYLEAVELLWLRTHFFYEQVADAYPQLGISDTTYRAAAYEADNLAELAMFTGKSFDDSSCVVP